MSQLQFLLEMHSIIACIIIIIVYSIMRSQRDGETNLLVMIIAFNACDLFWDIMAYSQQGVVSDYGFRMHMAANFMLISIEYIETYLLTYYIYLVLEKYTGREYKAFYRFTAISEIGLMGLLISNFFTGWYFYFDEFNYYQRGKYFMVSVVVHIIILLIGIVLSVKHRKQLPRLLFFNMLLYFLCPALGMLLQVVFFGFSFLNIFISISIIMFFVVKMHALRRDAIERDKILVQTQICLMGAQMNPHFVFNALSTIGYLIEEDSEAASDALVHFSNYLRGSIYVDPNKGLVPIRDEWNMALEFAYIEKLRFESDIELEFDHGDIDLKVPYLTIEPLVENAIKHGLRRKKGKGLVVVKVREAGRYYIITVSDNGVGFDPNSQEYKNKKHGIGVHNVKERIRLICNGTLNIVSQPGKGTTVVIKIPVQSQENAR